MNQRLERVAGCHPMLKRPVLALIEQCEAKLKKTLFVVYGFRSVAEQMEIYKKGRSFDVQQAAWVVSNARAIVTRALPGTSAHNVISLDGSPASMAVDLIPFDAAGQLDWNLPETFWNRLYELAWKCGLDPIGDIVGSYLDGDLGHFEEPGWKLKLEGLGCYQPRSEAPPTAAPVPV